MNLTPSHPERWLRGPVPEVPTPLQPVAHALLQAVEEVGGVLDEVDRAALWTSLGGAASIGFHLRHMAGSLDRLFTYARGEGLSETQRGALAEEARPALEVGTEELLDGFRRAVAEALVQLGATPVESLDEFRAVGRAGLPSSVRGLLHHAADHTMRHAGQLLTTAKILRGGRMGEGEGAGKGDRAPGVRADEPVVGPLDPGSYAVVFTSVRRGGEGGYEEMGERMVELAREQPGFLGVESAREGAFGITVSYWASDEAILAWRRQVEHLGAQRLGRDRWYRRYGVHVAKVERSRTFSEI